MTIKHASKELLSALSSIYDERESAAIVDWVFECVTGWKRLERMINKNEELSEQNSKRLQKITSELMKHRPVQYILNEAFFHGMRLYVDEHVLIPRPETEELVEWALEEVKSDELSVMGRNRRVLDVGTGCGCIPLALKKEIPSLEVYACDVSKGALEVARKNAVQQNAAINFIELNFLDERERESLPLFDLIISNPPYISEKEKDTIDKHVIEYEPHLALFVPEDDSLIFYKHLANFGKTHLQGGGCMMMEIHYAKGEAVKQLFEQNGYKVGLKKDLHAKERMVKVWK